MTELVDKNCTHQDGPALSPTAAESLLGQLDGWNLCDDGNSVHRTFEFKNYYRTMAFVNAVAWIAHREDHHPDLAVGYNRCAVRFSTHSVGGLSENDFISAAKIDALQKD
jgi:4a-hydroxytetrahydrobiopterin dehydratase